MKIKFAKPIVFSLGVLVCQSLQASDLHVESPNFSIYGDKTETASIIETVAAIAEQKETFYVKSIWYQDDSAYSYNMSSGVCEGYSVDGVKTVIYDNYYEKRTLRTSFYENSTTGEKLWDREHTVRCRVYKKNAFLNHIYIAAKDYYQARADYYREKHNRSRNYFFNPFRDLRDWLSYRSAQVKATAYLTIAQRYE